MTVNPSSTAQLVAALRAGGGPESPLPCRDPWALALAGPHGCELAQQLLSITPHIGLWVGLRTIYFDEAVERSSREIPQVVLLGAGLDTRAARLATRGRRFFEVDTPASQALKLERLRRLEGYPVEAARYASCDFESEDFVSAMVATGFDPSVPALVVWEGVSYYLREAAVRATLERAATSLHPASRILFDFVGQKLIRGRASTSDQDTLELVRALGEPMLWGTNDVLPLLYATGFRRVRVDSFDELALRYTGSYDRARRFRFQHVAKASVLA